MRLLVKLAGIGVAGMLLAGCRPAAPGDDWGGLVAPSVLAKASLKYYWRNKVELAEDEAVRQIWRLADNLYALTSAGRLVALDAASGVYKWDVKVAGPTQKVFRPCHADNVLIHRPGVPTPKPVPDEPPETRTLNAVIINTLTYALVIDREEGKVARKVEFPLFAANTPCSSDGVHVYVGSVRGWYYSLYLDSGLLRWRMSTQDLMTAPPVYFARRLYVASQDARFYAIDPEVQEKRSLWTQITDGPLTAPFVVDARGCFVPSQDYRLYAYEAGTGEELWTFRAQGPLMRPVQVGQRTVYQFAEKDRFYAVDLASGRTRWTSDEARQVLATVEAGGLSGVANATQPYVFVLTEDRHLLMIPETLGDVEVKAPMTGLDLFVASATSPVIHAATADGKFVCLAPQPLRQLKAEMFLD